MTDRRGKCKDNRWDFDTVFSLRLKDRLLRAQNQQEFLPRIITHLEKLSMTPVKHQFFIRIRWCNPRRIPENRITWIWCKRSNAELCYIGPLFKNTEI